MRKCRVPLLIALAIAAAGLAQARETPRWRERTIAANTPALPAKQTLAYGADPLQQLDFWPAGDGSHHAPLVIFVHGGGWKRGSKDNADGTWKAPHFTASGYAYASINYRLVPDASIEQQGADVAAALRYLVNHAANLGIDMHRIVIMGHSAGAHLVALVGTDERYLKGAGLSFSNLRGVIPVDGAAYDVPSQMNDGPGIIRQTYVQAFGTDPARQGALSPTRQAAAPNAPAFLLIHVQRPDGIAQNKALEAALRKAGTPVQRFEFPGTGLRGHAEINRSLGDPAYAVTPVVDEWLTQVFAR